MKKENFPVETSTSQLKTTRTTLVDTYTLRVDYVSKTIETTYEKGNPLNVVSKKVFSEEILKTFFYNLSEISKNEVIMRRKNKIPTFLLKIDGKYYYSRIPANLTLIGEKLLGTHMCATCKKISPLSDEDGGCEKVRNIARFIEKYDWISKGYETFGTTHDCFFVAECNHCQSYT